MAESCAGLPLPISFSRAFPSKLSRVEVVGSVVLSGYCRSTGFSWSSLEHCQQLVMIQAQPERQLEHLKLKLAQSSSTKPLGKTRATFPNDSTPRPQRASSEPAEAECSHEP